MSSSVASASFLRARVVGGAGGFADSCLVVVRFGCGSELLLAAGLGTLFAEKYEASSGAGTALLSAAVGDVLAKRSWSEAGNESCWPVTWLT